MTPANRSALRARVWRRAFDAGAVADLLRETTNAHARRDSGAWVNDDDSELAGIAADLDARLDRVREQLVASAALSDGVMEYTSLAPRPRDLRAAWQLVAIGVQVELDARARAARTPHSRALCVALAKRWDRHVSVVDATWEACS